MTEFKHMISSLEGFEENLFENSARWKLLEELYQNNWVAGTLTTPSIPKIIHQVWVGSNPFPERYQWWVESWKKYNPDYEYKLWTDKNIQELNLPKIYNQITNPGPKSDFIRYYVLNRFGGIYIDTDFECVKSFDSILPYKFITSVGYPWKNWERVEMYPGLMACTPGHPIMKKLVDQISKLTIEEYGQKSVHYTTSSYFFTDVFFEVVKKYQKGIVATPPDIFYPFPNHKEHHKDTGGKYIKPCSLAVHHWEVSWGKKEKELDWIQGEKFVGCADFVYAPKVFTKDDYAKYPNTFDPSELRPINFVYTNIMYLGKLLRIVANLPQQFVILAHNGDQHIDDGVIGTYNSGKRIAEEPYIIPDNVIKLYSTNVDVIHPKIDLIPLGVENSMWKTTKKEIIAQLRLSQKVVNPGLVYMNHAINTNQEERQKVYDMFKDKSWVTVGINRGNRKGYDLYYQAIYNHKFVLNPQGNCFDNHRMWEAWYLGSIPISKSGITINKFKNYPHVIVEDWDQVTEEFLNKEYQRIINTPFNEEKLWFSYWRNKVRSIA